MIGALALRAFVPLALLGLYLDVAQPLPSSILDSAGRISLDGVLIAGAVAIWREWRKEKADSKIEMQLERAAFKAEITAERDRSAVKDAQVMAMVSESIKATTLMLSGFHDLRDKIVDIADSVEDIVQDRGMVSIKDAKDTKLRRESKHDQR